MSITPQGNNSFNNWDLRASGVDRNTAKLNSETKVMF